MKHFFNQNNTSLSTSQYNGVICKYLTDKLGIFKPFDFDHLLDVATVEFNYELPNKIYFHINFSAVPKLHIFNCLLNNQSFEHSDGTQIVFSWNTDFLYEQVAISRILEVFLLNQFPQNPFTQRFGNHLVQISHDVITFILENEIAYNGFQIIHRDILKFLKTFFNKNDLKIDLLQEFEELLEPQFIADLPTINHVETKVKPKQTSSSQVKKATIQNEVFWIWQKGVKEVQNKKKATSIKIRNEQQYYTVFIDKKLSDKPLFQKLKINDHIRILDINEIDSKRSRYFDFALVDFEIVTDQNHETRIESRPGEFANLYLHTKSSTYDGLFNYKDFLEVAKKFGHKALAISDWNSVFSYPMVEADVKNSGIKPIYGVEFELLDLPIVLALNANGKQTNFIDATYCVFDIETTGLNALFDDIIEIAVHKFANGTEIDSYQMFVKTDQKLKPFIKDLTNITDELLAEQGVEIKTALQKFVDFVGDDVLIAHNGISFDYRFLNSKLVQHNFAPLSNILIDTLQLSRAFFSEERSHNLGAFCRRLEVTYEELSAHRADYDVKVLKEAYLKLFDYFDKFGINLYDSISQLNEKLQSVSLIKKNFSFTICAYARNQEGIRDIYKLLSTAHIDNFYRTASLTWELINSKRENLIIVNSIDNSDLWEEVLMNEQVAFETKVKNYDYVFIPSPKLFRHEVNRLNYDQKQLEQAIKNFYELTIKNNKKPIGSGAVKYIDTLNEDQYSTIVHAKQIGNVSHRLFSYQKPNNILPDYQFRTSDLLREEFGFLNLNPTAETEFIFKNNQAFVNDVDDDIVIIPKKLSPPNLPETEENFVRVTKENFYKKYGSNPNDFLVKRLDRELNAIIKHNFSIVYWASYLLVKKSNEDGYLVASRGSVGSSLVAYLLNISEVNPLPPHYFCADCQYLEFDHEFGDSGFDLKPKPCPHCQKKMFGDGQNIPFETFMGFNADKIPDIDLNFSGLYQPRAHNFLRELFGHEACFRAGTMSKIADKTAYGLAKNYFEIVDENNLTIGRLDWIVDQITNVRRTSSQHPGGILVIPKELSVYNFSPINYPADDVSSDWKTTHFDYNFLHDCLLKFDVLGHDDPTILRMLQNLTKIDPYSIPNHDPKILQMFSDCRVMGIQPNDILGETTGAFGLPEFGTDFVRGMLKVANPQSFGDLIRISGLSHGTDVWRGNAELLIKKNNLKLSEVINCRDDIMIYLIKKGIDPLVAFNIMEIVRKENRTIPPEMIEILLEHKIPKWYIDSANLIQYMFPKAHAAAYVLMAWRVAFFKLYYPKEYYATYFSIRSDYFDVETLIQNDIALIKAKYLDIRNRMNSKVFAERDTVKNKEKKLLTIYEVAIEMLSRNIQFENIRLMESHSLNFIPLPNENKILIPFIAIDGLGAVLAEKIVSEREIKPFLSKKDLKERTRLSGTLLFVFEKLDIVGELGETNQISIFDV
ncbi:DNA polymerase-3 subunit alpha (Gram-positive type) [Mycoplasmoides fastidiosum]|uniref:DNA polymerase III PolC-type n=1 Tax=Mycoplasmoides fastidiosum TaxID=92758 RepID=A0ABU0LZR0_9BACT|nr:PolC-type DNA polymerase III [Mycoplasmoides fastidiosum]MDQ0514197.1 DNA polymerase-3 subunit alpha (Gram-positive type) [Mycoplasmoides fastidiosum]UUD37393.1 PolC-type DNA polymerase III [Mycoplasmoides fastidiosum]